MSEKITVPWELNEYFDPYHQPEVCAVLFTDEEIYSRPRDPEGLRGVLQSCAEHDQYLTLLELANVCVRHNCTYRMGLEIWRELF